MFLKLEVIAMGPGVLASLGSRATQSSNQKEAKTPEGRDAPLDGRLSLRRPVILICVSARGSIR